MFSALIASIALSAVPTPEAGPTLVFEYDASQIQNTQTAEIVYNALRARAKNLCDSNQRLTIDVYASEQACVEELVSKAVAEMNSERVTRVHMERGAGSRSYRLASN